MSLALGRLALHVPMRLLDRYIIGKTLWPLFASLGVALLALMLERTVRLLDIVVNEGGPFYLLLRMLAYLVPQYLGLALPAAFFIGILLATARLSSDNEFDAIHAVGVGYGRLLMPLMVVAMLLVIGSTVIVGFMQPLTRYAYRALVHIVTNTAWDIALERGAFFSGFGNMTIMVDDIGDGGRSLAGIFIHEQKPDGGSITTTARKGNVYRSADNERLILSLESGLRIENDVASRNSTVVTFDNLNLPLDFSLVPTPFRQRGRGYNEFTLVELWNSLSDPPPGLSTDGLKRELHERVVRILSLLFLPCLAIPLGTASRRASRTIAFGLAIVIIVLYHHVLQLGNNLGQATNLSPWLTMWVPFLCFSWFSVWAFHSSNSRPGYNVFTVAIESTLDAVERGRRGLARSLTGA